jgi:proteasome lid subunit RPN8/RPN11
MLDVRRIDPAVLEHEPVPRVEQELRIFISEAAFDRAVERGGADTSREVGGVLVGVLRRDESGPYLRIDGTIDALHAEEKGAELTFTHATWEHIHAQMDSVYQGKQVVGWYHTHPGFGVFLSDRDTFIQRSFFDLPFQIALVYDPKSREHGVFAWRDGQALRCRRYWIGAHEHHWDGARSSEARAAHEHGASGHATVQVAGEAPDARPASSADAAARGLDWLTLAVAGLALVCLAGLGGWWLGTRAAGEVLTRAEAEIARAQARGAREAITGLNVELLDVVRTALSDELTRRHAEAITAAMRRAEIALQALGPAAASPADSLPMPPALDATTGPVTADGETAGQSRTEIQAAITEARSEASALLNERAALRAALDRVRDVGAQRSSADARDLAVQRNALGTLYADLADDFLSDGDTRRAARYLLSAAAVDPDNAARYEKKLRAFDAHTRLRRPKTGPGSASEAHDNGGAAR